MAEDPRILTFSVPLVSGTTTHFRIQFGSDLEDWTLLKIGGATDLAVALLTGRTYVLDGVNATDDDNNNKAAASTPPNWYRVQLKSASGYGAWGEPFVFPSLADFLHNLRHQLQDPALIGGTDLLPAEAYRMRVQSAIEAFERVQPRETSQLFSLTSGDYTYSLPDEWATGYSRVSRIEYPADETPRRFYKSDAVFADEQQSEWRDGAALLPHPAQAGRQQHPRVLLPERAPVGGGGLRRGAAAQVHPVRRLHYRRGLHRSGQGAVEELGGSREDREGPGREDVGAAGHGCSRARPAL
jgi:hypothetical protein